MTTPTTPPKSRAEIRALIRLRGDYTNVRRFPDTYINSEIQTAFNHMHRIVGEAHQDWWTTDGTVVTAAAQSFIAPPPDTKVIKAIDRLDGNEWVPLVQIGLEHRNRFGPSQDKPLAFRPSARGLELYPTPNAVYTLRVTYDPKPPALTENEQHEFYDGWEDYVFEKTLFELDSREGKSMGDRAAKLEMAEKALRASSSERKQSEPEYLVLRERVGGDPFDDGMRD